MKRWLPTGMVIAGLRAKKISTRLAADSTPALIRLGICS